MQSRERGRRGKDVQNPLGGWRAGFLGWAGRVQGRDCRGLHNGEWVEQVPVPKTDLHCDEPAFCMNEAWQKSGKPTGGGNPDRGRPGLATGETMRTAGEADGVAGTRVAERHGYSSRLSSVSGGGTLQGRIQDRQRGTRTVSKAFSEGFSEAVRRDRDSPRRSIERRRNRLGSECDPTHVR